MRRVDLILIDLDGTLVDSVPDIALAIDQMMSQLGMPSLGIDAVRHWIGNGIERLVARALQDQLKNEPDSELFQSALDLFKNFYAQCNGHHSRLFQGVREGLDWLKSQGYVLACVTNKVEQFTVPLLKALDIHHYFRLIISGDTCPKKKPDPLPLLHAAEFFQVNPQNALMLGDSIHDVTAARAAGFQIISVSYGYNHGIDINEAAPDAIIDSFFQLPNLIEKMDSNRCV